MQKTKWQQLMDAPKGCIEYNPSQSFALQVFWIVRSPTAASEMIERGFNPCAKATMRDTPTTLAYIFRVSRDQSLAKKLKEEVKTIGQHPHYQPSFKSIEMGIPRPGIEQKLKNGGIDLKPLSWGPNEPIEGHEKELDFDPVVLECTEVYLDNRSFYEHSASQDWMKSYPEILKPSRSLKPTTYCVGTPSKEIWEGVLESSLKAIRFDETKEAQLIQPGIFLCTNNKSSDKVFFLELDIKVSKDKMETLRSQLSKVQQELEAPLMIVLPTNLEVASERDHFEIRIMLSVLYSPEVTSTSLKLLKEGCLEVEGRIISFNCTVEDAQQFVDRSGLQTKVSVLDGHEAEKSKLLAGYPLHPLFQKLVVNNTLNYKP